MLKIILGLYLRLVGWLEFSVPLRHKYGYIRDEVFTYNTFYVFNVFLNSYSFFMAAK